MQWVSIRSGVAGREPANLLVDPVDSTLYVFAWPGGVPTLHTGRWGPVYAEGQVSMQVTWATEVVGGISIRGNWPYSAAGMDVNGKLCVMCVNGGSSREAYFYWSCKRRGTVGGWCMANKLTFLCVCGCLGWVRRGRGGVALGMLHCSPLSRPAPMDASRHVHLCVR